MTFWKRQSSTGVEKIRDCQKFGGRGGERGKNKWSPGVFRVLKLYNITMVDTWHDAFVKTHKTVQQEE